MAKKNKNPEVRFKGFTEDWKHQELGEFLDERKTMQKISEDAPILAFASGQGVIDRSERKSNNRDHLTLDQENKVYKLTELNDIVYNPSNLKYGAIDRNKHGRGVISPIYVTFTTEEEPSFIELIVKSEKFKLRALQYEEGTVVKRQSVSPENLLSLKVGISPSLDEQKKIGKLFDNIENLINHHQKKYDKLVILKKAMLDKMFPKNGAMVPDIRFKGFSEGWEEKPFGEIFNYERPDEYIVKSVEYSADFNIPVLTANKGFLLGYTNETNTFNKKCILFDDFTLDCKYVDFPFMVKSSALKILILKNETLDDLFFSFNLLKTTKIEIMGHARHYIGVVQPTSVLIPKIDEQQKIGDYFKNLDNQIALHQTQLDKMNNIKKACFSKMFVPQK